MELERILPFFENKTILVTGATGFLAKVFAEKILRAQPNVKKLYLLLRTSDNKSATQRFRNEILGKDLFMVLRNSLGANLESFISERVTPISGDVCDENLGIKDCILREEMWKEIDIVLNSAATTKFDERYDVALGTNTYGALHVLSFAQNCVKLKVLLHVSTAYVCSEMEGNILESPFYMGDTLKGTSKLDINAEKELVKEYLDRLRVQGATNEAIISTMKDFGIERTIDGVISAYAKGKLECFTAHPKSILDIIPADMVVNSMIVAMVAHANKSSQIIFHVGSSLRNPMRLCTLREFLFRYFTRNPWIGKNGKSIKVGKAIVFSSMARFHAYMAIRYKLPLKVLWLANEVLCQYHRDICIDRKRKVALGMRLVELYKPYVFFTGSFDDSNTEKLRVAARESDADLHLFDFDPKCIDWEDYIMNTHIPGLLKYSMKP
ncbi:hypothetical protein RGQ29_001521 [Quercus rubra]|uniref:Fatty acyl-CoA reductase n=1 Tax=Quercus rubra TaxID=3512 RepID=A0AAN7GD96_QUERU|nr:hypothetical protein RGQ29_001521 [Quercus rubra]